MVGPAIVITVVLILGVLLWWAVRRTDNPPRDSPHRYDQDGPGVGGDGV